MDERLPIYILNNSYVSGSLRYLLITGENITVSGKRECGFVREVTITMIEEIIARGRQWILIVTVPGIFAFIALILYVNRKIANKKLESLASAFNARIVSDFFHGPHVIVNNSGCEVKIKIRKGSKNSPPCLILQQMTPIGVGLTISKENIVTRTLNKFGLLKDVTIGNSLFDDRYLVRSKNPMKAQNYLRNTIHTDAIDFLFTEDIDTIESNDDSVTIKKSNYRKEDLEPQQIRSLLDLMRKLAS